MDQTRAKNEETGSGTKKSLESNDKKAEMRASRLRHHVEL